jgi:hypothetical protein
MRSLFSSLFEKCSVSLQLSGDGLRIAGKGVFGVLATLVLFALILHYAPQLAPLFSSH